MNIPLPKAETLLALLLLLCVSATTTARGANDYPANWCRDGLFPSDEAGFKRAKVGGNRTARVHFFSDDEDCPLYESLDQDEVISISGHDNVSLDLAPYKLNSRGAPIGFRLEHIWLPTSDWSTRLTLYRIEGERLSEVFSEVVVERVYPAASDRGRRIIDKTVSTISLAPPSRTAGGGFNEMVVKKAAVECFDENNDEDCDPKHEDLRPVKTRTELWRFDGRRYVRAPPTRR